MAKSKRKISIEMPPGRIEGDDFVPDWSRPALSGRSVDPRAAETIASAEWDAPIDKLKWAAALSGVMPSTASEAASGIMSSPRAQALQMAAGGVGPEGPVPPRGAAAMARAQELAAVARSGSTPGGHPILSMMDSRAQGEIARRRVLAEAKKSVGEVPDAGRELDKYDTPDLTVGQGGGTPAQKITLGSGGTQTQKATVTKEEAAQSAEAARMRYEEAGRSKTALNKLDVELAEGLKARQEQHKEWMGRYGSMADGILAKGEEADRIVGEMRARVSQMKIDPTRYWTQMDSTQKALGALAVGLASFGGTGAQAWKVIQHGIDTDVAAQRANVQSAIQQLQLSQQQQAQLWSRWGAVEGIRRSEANAMATFAVATLSAKAKNITERSKYDDIIFSARDAEAKAYVPTRDKVTKTAQWRQQYIPPTAPGGKVDPVMQRNALKAATDVAGSHNRMSKFVEAMLKTNPRSWSAIGDMTLENLRATSKWAATIIPGTKLGVLEAQKYSLGIQMAKAFGAGQVSDQEGRAINAMLVSANQGKPAFLQSARQALEAGEDVLKPYIDQTHMMGDAQGYKYTWSQLAGMRKRTDAVLKLINAKSW